jgi:hypothetical protein
LTEREFYIQVIPQITEIIMECRRLSVEQYREWKIEVLRTTSPEAKLFAEKVLQVIDTILFLDAKFPKPKGGK